MYRCLVLLVFIAFIYSNHVLASFSPTAAELQEQDYILEQLNHLLDEPHITSKEESVELAHQLFESLNEEQKEEMILPLNKAIAHKWSNLPINQASRNGVPLSELNTQSFILAMLLLQANLSPLGFEHMTEIIKADYFLSTTIKNPPFKWGAQEYYFSIHGNPSFTKPWMIQLTGHHLAENIFINRSKTTITPEFTGTQPRMFQINNRTYHPMDAKVNAVHALLLSLCNEQKQQSKLNDEFNDILLGPGYDQSFPTQEGLLIKNLNTEQQIQVKHMIEEWVAHAPYEARKALLHTYLSQEQLQKTTIAWAGSTSIKRPGSYFRIDGPQIWIEIYSKEGVANKKQTHVHSIWRDKLNDYGGILK